MSAFNSFQKPLRAVVVGASGGIGAAVLEAIAASERCEQVYALSRSANGNLPAKARHLFIDFASPQSLDRAAAQIEAEGPLDLVFVVSGILHRGDEIQPEKTMADLDADALRDVFDINTIGPALVATRLLPLLRKESKTVFAALSARVGSIGDNRLGGWISYRASKAALNMIVKTLSIEHARKRPKSLVVALHPGTVDTGLSQPFTRRVPEDKLFTPADAAAKLLQVIDGLDDADTGGFFAWDGKAIPW